MKNFLAVSATLGETRTALVEGGVPVEFFVERSNDRGIMGNVYIGKVAKILKGIQAAFIEIGMSKSAFLHLDDISTGNTKDLAQLFGEGEEWWKSDEAKKRLAAGRQIEKLLKVGDEILVQVAKNPMGGKGARLTTYISIPGRAIVLMPGIEHVGISRKIENREERERLRDILKEIRPKGFGLIARTASAGMSRRDFKSDMNFLLKLWSQVLKQRKRVRSPALLHDDLDMPLRLARDLFRDEMEKFVVDDESCYRRVMHFVNNFMPKMRDRVELWKDKEPLFDALGIEMELARALQRKVWLKSGGYIVIDTTEALTVIDVNTGRSTARGSMEETITKANLEAAKEIAYQLRLRNIGGIIIIDFIDMEKAENRKKVWEHLQEAVKPDRARSNIVKISELGLIEMTRKRTSPSISQVFNMPCPYCEGEGTVRSVQSVSFDVLRKLRRDAAEMRGKPVVVLTHPDVADMLLGEQRHAVEKIERAHGLDLDIRPRPGLHVEQFEVAGRDV